MREGALIGRALGQIHQVPLGSLLRRSTHSQDVRDHISVRHHFDGLKMGRALGGGSVYLITQALDAADDDPRGPVGVGLRRIGENCGAPGWGLLQGHAHCFLLMERSQSSRGQGAGPSSLARWKLRPEQPCTDCTHAHIPPKPCRVEPIDTGEGRSDEVPVLGRRPSRPLT